MIEDKIQFIAKKVLDMDHMFDDRYAYGEGKTKKFNPIKSAKDCDFFLKAMAEKGNVALLIWHASGRISCCFDHNGDSSCLNHIGESRGCAVVDSAYKLLWRKND